MQHLIYSKIPKEIVTMLLSPIYDSELTVQRNKAGVGDLGLGRNGTLLLGTDPWGQLQSQSTSRNRGRGLLS